MPYCVVTAAGGGGAAHTPEEEVRMFYQRYGHGATKVLLIIGTAAACTFLSSPFLLRFCNLFWVCFVSSPILALRVPEKMEQLP
jgi:hypothetical protein